ARHAFTLLFLRANSRALFVFAFLAFPALSSAFLRGFARDTPFAFAVIPRTVLHFEHNQPNVYGKAIVDLEPPLPHSPTPPLIINLLIRITLLPNFPRPATHQHIIIPLQLHAWIHPVRRPFPARPDPRRTILLPKPKRRLRK